MKPSELERLAKAATPGPWNFERIAFDNGDFCYERHGRGMIQIYEHNYDSPMHAKFDADYIAAASPDVILGMLQELSALRRIAALCWEEMNHGFDLPSDVFDAVETYYAQKIAEEALK